MKIFTAVLAAIGLAWLGLALPKNRLSGVLLIR